MVGDLVSLLPTYPAHAGSTLPSRTAPLSSAVRPCCRVRHMLDRRWQSSGKQIETSSYRVDCHYSELYRVDFHHPECPQTSRAKMPGMFPKAGLRLEMQLLETFRFRKVAVVNVDIEALKCLVTACSAVGTISRQGLGVGARLVLSIFAILQMLRCTCTLCPINAGVNSLRRAYSIIVSDGEIDSRIPKLLD